MFIDNVISLLEKFGFRYSRTVENGAIVIRSVFQDCGGVSVSFANDTVNSDSGVIYLRFINKKVLTEWQKIELLKYYNNRMLNISYSDNYLICTCLIDEKLAYGEELEATFTYIMRSIIQMDRDGYFS